MANIIQEVESNNHVDYCKGTLTNKDSVKVEYDITKECPVAYTSLVFSKNTCHISVGRYKTACLHAEPRLNMQGEALNWINKVFK